MRGLSNIGHVAKAGQDPANRRQRQGFRDLGRQAPDTVIHAGALLPGLQPVIVAHIGHHGPWEDPVGCEAETCQHRNQIDQRSGAVRQEKSDQHGQRPNPHADGVGGALIHFAAQPLPERQRDGHAHQHQAHHQGGLGLHEKLVLDVVSHQDFDKGERQVEGHIDGALI